jgi:hypothetical protein
MIISALRKAIAQLALGNLMQGWAAPETDLLCEAGLLPPDSHAAARTVNAYCLPPSLSSYEVSELALRHAAKSLGEDVDAVEWKSARVRLIPSNSEIRVADNRVSTDSSREVVVGKRK